jgi:hypothetical protein
MRNDNNTNRHGPSFGNGITFMSDRASIHDKIKAEIDPDADVVYWRIKFNLALDSSSVNDKNMKVIDTNSYILETEVSYEPETQMIVLSPVEAYEPDEYYILKITNKVRSEKGQRLKGEINILFKLQDGKISRFESVKPGMATAVPKPRPKDFKLSPRAVTPQRRFTSAKVPDTLFILPFHINAYIGIMGFMIIVSGIFLEITLLVLTGLVVTCAGVAHLAVQLKDADKSSHLWYNIGAFFFNHKRYKLSAGFFEKALNRLPSSKAAQYALKQAEDKAQG